MPLAAPTITSCNPNYNSVSLGWSNGDNYDSIEVRRDGAQLVLLSGTATSYLDETCQDGTTYSYVIRGSVNDPPPGESADSGAVGAITPLIPASNLGGSCVSNVEIHLQWQNNTGNASGVKVYRNGGLVATLGASVSEWNDTGLTPATWYSYGVYAYNAVTQSACSNVIDIFTADPPAAPSNPQVTAVSTSQINGTFQDNSNNETGFKVEESADGTSGWSLVKTLAANVTAFQITGLSSNTLRYYRIYAYNDSGMSGYSAVVNARTFAAISDPTNLVATPWSDTEIELVFQDNSSEEDGHEVYRKEGAGAYALIITLAPNEDFYRDPGLTKGHTYVYKVRAKQGAAFSGYSNEATATTISEPAAPTGLAISEIKDKSMRLTWTLTTGEVGYKIEKSTDGGSNYTEIAVVTAGVSYFLVRGLAASTEYYFKIRAYNKAGNSSYTSAVHDTTLAAYTPTAFRKLVRKPIAKLIYLIEMNPKITLAGWTLTSGKTYTYEVGVQERGIDIEEAFENGTALTKKTSIADVESTASSFYFDFYGRKFYIHTSGGDSPINYLIEGGFWLYFTNYSPGASPTVFNEKNYLPLLEKADIPDAMQELSPLFEGNFSIASGSITIKQAKIDGEYYWDKRYARYIFENRKVRVLAGGPDFTYAEFEAVFPAFIDSLSISDQAITFDLKDFRGGLSRDLPINHFWKTDYAALSDNDNGKVIPLGIGTLVNFVPVCINATDRKYKLRDGRIKSIAAVKQNGTTLTGGTDYYIDYQRGIITLSRSLAFDAADTITVNFDGLCNMAGELLSNGADLFIWICQNLPPGLSLAELDLDSIYKTKYDCTRVLASPFHRQTTSDEVFRALEHSCSAYTYQDSQGRLGFRTLDTTPGSDVCYVRNCEISDFSRNRGNESVFSAVEIYYNEDPQHDGAWSVARVAVNQAVWKKRAANPLPPIYTWLTTQADAEAVATAIKNDLEKDYINFSVHTLLFGCMAGDLIYFSRDRLPSAGGSANEILLRIMSIQKSISSGKTIIRAVTV